MRSTWSFFEECCFEVGDGSQVPFEDIGDHGSLHSQGKYFAISYSRVLSLDCVSSLINHEKLFAPTDNDILNDFELLIDQKSALITHDTLPVIEAIP